VARWAPRPPERRVHCRGGKRGRGCWTKEHTKERSAGRGWPPGRPLAEGKLATRARIARGVESGARAAPATERDALQAGARALGDGRVLIAQQRRAAQGPGPQLEGRERPKVRQQLARLFLAQRRGQPRDEQPVDVPASKRDRSARRAPRRARDVEHVAQRRVHLHLHRGLLPQPRGAAEAIQAAVEIQATELGAGAAEIEEVAPAVALRQKGLVQRRQPRGVLRPVAAGRDVVAERVVVILVVPVATGLLDGLVELVLCLVALLHLCPCPRPGKRFCAVLAPA